jgi:patatin-like phospholipase/acyl hydrolase
MSNSISSGAPLRILSIDGGGVRGISSLYILKEIMAQVQRQYRIDYPNDTKKFKPCDVFDIICGTSTGGLIALMLGRLKMVCIAVTLNFPNAESLVRTGCQRSNPSL